MGISKSFGQANTFEQLYNEVRQKENRILSIEQIKKLPETPPSFVHHAEWNLRKASTAGLLKRLDRWSQPAILDLGCGNGWLMYKMAQKAGYVAGIDINLLELEQAEEVLAAFDNTALFYGDIFEINLEKQFDVILLNGSVQYFPQLQKLIDHLHKYLLPEGEIHIVDSPFYADKNAAQKARDRSSAYYAGQGVADMVSYYHHHTFTDLKPYHYQALFDPQHWWQKLKRKWSKVSPLFWIVIKSPLK